MSSLVFDTTRGKNEIVSTQLGQEKWQDLPESFSSDTEVERACKDKYKNTV